MKIKLMDIIILGGVAVIGYLGYKYITGISKVKETVAAATQPIYNIFTQPIPQTIADTTGFIAKGLTEIGQQKTGFQLPAPIEGEKPAEVNLAEQFVNFATGVLEVNPFTAPVMPVVETIMGGVSDILKSEYVKALPPTEMTTPTIPKYTTDYEKEILGSAAPEIIKSKIIAGKIW